MSKHGDLFAGERRPLIGERGLRPDERWPAGAEEGRDTALVSAALRLADELGPDGVTIDAIAEAAGVSPRTFFNYFSSK
jgi:AcrR family transcriptional regulator